MRPGRRRWRWRPPPLSILVALFITVTLSHSKDRKSRSITSGPTGKPRTTGGRRPEKVGSRKGKGANLSDNRKKIVTEIERLKKKLLELDEKEGTNSSKNTPEKRRFMVCNGSSTAATKASPRRPESKKAPQQLAKSTTAQLRSRNKTENTLHSSKPSLRIQSKLKAEAPSKIGEGKPEEALKTREAAAVTEESTHLHDLLSQMRGIAAEQDSEEIARPSRTASRKEGVDSDDELLQLNFANNKAFNFEPPPKKKGPKSASLAMEVNPTTDNLSLWKRDNRVVPTNTSQPLVFMITSIFGHDIEFHRGKATNKNYNYYNNNNNYNDNNNSWKGRYGSFKNKQLAARERSERRDEYVLRVFGVTADGLTVGATLRFFKPYFYILIPPQLQDKWKGEGIEESDIQVPSDERIEDDEGQQLKPTVFGSEGNSSTLDGVYHPPTKKTEGKDKSSPSSSSHPWPPMDVEDHTRDFHNWLKEELDDLGWALAGVRLVYRKKLFPFTNRRRFKFLKLKFRSELAFRRANQILSRVVRIQRIANFQPITFDLYEVNVNPTMRFTQAADILTAGWVSLGNYVVPSVPQSRSQIDVVAHWRCIRNHDEQQQGIAPIVVASFDIEVESSKAREQNSKAFPNAINERDTVSQIGTTLWRYGTKDVLKHVVTLASPKDHNVDPVPGVVIEVASSERELLQKWVEFVRVTNPDGFTGYNIFGFDWKYLMDRDCPNRQGDDGEYYAGPKGNALRLLSRLLSANARPTRSQLKSSAYGVNTFDVLDVPGRFQIDLLPYFRREHKLESYRLDAVAEHFTGQRKDDLPPSEIFRCLGGNSAEVAKVAKYCAQDSALVIQLLRQQQIIPNLIEMAKVTRVPIDWLVTRGQQVKVFAQILHECQLQGYCVPYWSRRRDGNVKEEKFIGATVLKASQGAYMERPIAGLDFASLYPSIMIAHNIDYTSIVLNDLYRDLPGVEYETISWWYGGKNHTYTFVQNQKGILPSLLEKLWKFRKQAKKDMRQAASRADTLNEAIFNGKQLAIKVSMNSIYGFTGADNGMLPCKAIAASVTTWGRKSIEASKRLVEEGWPDLPNATVVYGDTDSIYTMFNVNMSREDAMQEVFRVSIEAAKRITRIFKKPMELEFEKVFFPFMLFTKKRYAGLVWENPERAKKLDYKGIQVVRRDNCKFVREICMECFEEIMYRMNISGAVAKARKAVDDLLADPMRVPIEKLILSKSLHDEYKSDTLPHVKLAEKLRQRDPMNAPKAGDRVPYVFVEGKGLQHERVEDPSFAIENKTKIDGLYYLQHQLQSPLETVFELLLKDVGGTLWRDAERAKNNELRGDQMITQWFKRQKL